MISVRRGLVAIAALVVLLCAAAAVLRHAAAAPSFADAKARFRPSEAWLLDRHGEVLAMRRIDPTVRRLEWVRLRDMSPVLPATVVGIEDRRFRLHLGVDPIALAGAARDNLHRLASGRRLRGASTITMQLASLIDPSLRAGDHERDIGKKWRQMWRAWQIEGAWTKDEILEAYLNLATYRGEVSGIAAASRVLFGKAPSGLDRAESLVLTALLGAPAQRPTAVATRACALAASGQPANADSDCTSVTRVALHALGGPADGPRQDAAPHLATRLLVQAGSRVTTSIDAALQRFVGSDLREHLLDLADRGVTDGAALVLDNATGEVLAYVGSSGNLSAAPQVDGVAALRQAGSTLKPFLYALAIERRLLSAGAILDDTALNIATPLGVYAPQNYDREFRGPVSARTALASSLNVPAVRTLALVGAEPFLATLRGLGFEALREDGDYYGFGLALGGADVRLAELANAYRTLANGGVWSPTTTVALPARAASRRVLSETASFIVADILSDPDARAATFGLSNPLEPGVWAAVKTGTSKDMRDNWCIGFTRRHTVAVWVGNFSGESMRDVSGITGAAPIWRDIVRRLGNDGTAVDAPVPAGVVQRNIRYLPPIEPPRREWFVAGSEAEEFRVGTAEDTQARRVGRIAYPGNGTILALDPDIPDARQRVLFEAHTLAPVRWSLDGIDVGRGHRVAWTPRSGRHRLELLDLAGVRLDTVAFEVRGQR